MSSQWTTSGLDLHLEIAGPGRRAGLENALRRAIGDGRLPPGEALPSTRALSAELGVSRGTVTAAYEQLIAEGYLSARRGAGTTVAGGLRPAPGPPASPGASEDAPRHDLLPGTPDLAAFPAAAWLRATRRVLAELPARALGYGDPRGRPELRAALAAYLARTRGVDADPERMLICSGYVQGLSLVARVLAGEGARAMAMEEPGLLQHRHVVRAAGLRVEPVSVDDGGVRVDLLGDVGGAVVTAAHQHPIGVTLAPARRRALVAWARDAGGVVMEDDYDGEFRYDREPVGALQAMGPDEVVYAGTAAKTLAPGLRLGWLVLPRRLVEPVAELKRVTDAGSDALAQLALADLVAGHAYDRHVRARRLAYRRRRDLLVARLARDAPGVVLVGVAAGQHAVALLPEGGPSSEAVHARAAGLGLRLGRTEEFTEDPEGHPETVVVGYGTPAEHAYPAALDALVTALRG